MGPSAITVQHLGIAQGVPNAENRTRLISLANLSRLSRTPSKMVGPIAELRQCENPMRVCGLQRATVQLSRALYSNLLAAAQPLHYSPTLDLAEAR
jgi:hypothetical protein